MTASLVEAQEGDAGVRRNNARAIVMMLVSTVGFAVMHAAIRHVSEEIHPVQAAFFRNFFGLLFFAPILMRSGLGFMRTSRLPLHALRSAINVVAMFCFFTALSITPLAKVTALGFSAPIFAALLGLFFLREKLRLRRWIAIFCGFLGMLIIVRPGMVVLDPGTLLVLASAVLWGVTLIIIKMLSRTESSLAITGYMTVFLSVLSFGPALYVWKTPDAQTWAWLAFIGVVGTFAQLTLTESFRLAETTVVMPFDFMKLVWAVLIGVLAFAEYPDFYTLIGALVIFSSAFFIAYRETRGAQAPNPAINVAEAKI
jgi:drug/metabolite transporter (DMT)-like permease